MGHHEHKLSDATIDYWLHQWARWMRGGDSRKLGYPRRSLGIATGGASEQFDDMVEREDRKSVRATDAAIRSLSLDQQSAIHHIYLAAVFRMRRDPVEVYKEALPVLEREMRGRGVI